MELQVPELRQNSSMADMYLEGVLLTPRITEMYDDILETTVDGAAYDIRDMLAVNGLRNGIQVNKKLYEDIIDAYDNPDFSLSDWVAEAPGKRVVTGLGYRTEAYVKFMLAQAGYDLPTALENLKRADEVANHGKKIAYEEIISNSTEAAQAAMLEVNDPREQVAMSLLSLGIGDNISLLYGNIDRRSGVYFNEENVEIIGDSKLDNGAYPVMPTVPLLLRDEEIRMILPASCRDQFLDGDNIDGYAVLHENILYTVRHSFVATDEQDKDFRIYSVAAQVMTAEGVDGIYLMATESR